MRLLFPFSFLFLILFFFLFNFSQANFKHRPTFWHYTQSRLEQPLQRPLQTRESKSKENKSCLGKTISLPLLKSLKKIYFFGSSIDSPNFLSKMVVIYLQSQCLNDIEDFSTKYIQETMNNFERGKKSYF
jgi:hypothetical protein